MCITNCVTYSMTESMLCSQENRSRWKEEKKEGEQDTPEIIRTAQSFNSRLHSSFGRAAGRLWRWPGCVWGGRFTGHASRTAGLGRIDQSGSVCGWVLEWDWSAAFGIIRNLIDIYVSEYIGFYSNTIRFNRINCFVPLTKHSCLATVSCSLFLHWNGLQIQCYF